VTQIVAAGNSAYAVVVADRRFTVRGKLVDEADDERNKLILIATPTARLGVAFCGLAWLGAFTTEPWLAQRLHEALVRGGGTPDLDWLCEHATHDFAPLPREQPERAVDQRCIWIVMAGFISEKHGAMPAYAQLSNAWPTERGIRAGAFHTEVFGPMNPEECETQRAYAMSFGAVRVEQSRVDELKRLVDQDRPPAAAVGQALRTLRAARSQTPDDGPIGPRSGAVIVWSEPSRQPEGRYFGPRGATIHFMPTLVTRHGIESSVTVERNATLVAPNAPCSCGSGRLFRRCHGASSSAVRGKHASARLPRRAEQRPRGS
jgi:hypothetical protein